MPERHGHANGALRPFTLEHFEAYASNLVLDSGAPWRLEDFQREVVADVFAGAPEVWMVVPEGNGKTTLMGGLALYFADYTPSAAVLLAAASRDQCGLLLGQAAGFVVPHAGAEQDTVPGVRGVPQDRRVAVPWPDPGVRRGRPDG